MIPLSLLFTGITALMIYGKNWPGLVIILLVISFIVHLLMTTYYQINGSTLIIKSGFLINKTLDIDSIEKVIETNNPLSSPAASLDRLEIRYNKSTLY